MTPTGQFIHTLQSLKPGDLGLLRQQAGLSLDESVDGFDLFAGVWWPLRARSQRTPRREVAWLVAKLYAFCPLPQTTGAKLAEQLGRLNATNKDAEARRQQRVDELLTLPLNQIEPALQWAIKLVSQNGAGLDWVRLTDDLSYWEREQTRIKWAEQFLSIAR